MPPGRKFFKSVATRKLILLLWVLRNRWPMVLSIVLQSAFDVWVRQRPWLDWNPAKLSRVSLLPNTASLAIQNTRCSQLTTGIAQDVASLGDYVVKPDGLTGGKGVKLSGAHLPSIEAAVGYCEELFKAGHARVVIEKLDGEEFSLQSFADGTHVVDMVLVQDHKEQVRTIRGQIPGGWDPIRAQYGTLPFLTLDQVKAASRINAAVAHALFKKRVRNTKAFFTEGSWLVPRGSVCWNTMPASAIPDHECPFHFAQ